MVSQFNIANIRNYADINQGVWTSILGTPMPTAPTGAYGAGWYSCGAIEAGNGISEGINVNETSVYLFQGGGLARKLRSQFEHPFTVICSEENAVTLGLARSSSAVTTTGGTAEVQTGAITATGGTMTYIWNGLAATGVSPTATTSVLATTLSSAWGITVAVTGTASAPIITFPIALGNVPPITLVTTALTGGSATISTTTPGVNAINTSQVVPASTQNIRQFGLDFSDGTVHVRLLLGRAEAVQTGTIDRKADSPTQITLQINPYLDSSNGGAFFTDINDDPARAAALFV
jgi:hypothetical protein